MKVRIVLAALAALSLAPAQALAWGSTGHRMVGVLATQALPADLPAFLRRAAVDIGETSREPDRSKGAGKVHDSDRDPGHFIDIDDEGKALGGPSLSALPPTRADYEKALQAVGQNSWNAGYLPYSIVDRYQQLTLDFAYWRVLKAAEANRAWRPHRAFFRADRLRREAKIIQTLGELSHFVGDGSQPLHVSSHYNGWGEGPNPQGFTQAKVHSPFEGDFVVANVRIEAVRAAMRPPRRLEGPVEAHVAAYLGETAALVVPFYALEKAGGLAPADPRGVAFAVTQLAVGASELRDLAAAAWGASAASKVGWRPVAVADVVAGRVDPYPALIGVD